MNGFYGTFLHTLDPKNRVFVPAKLRNDLGETFFITRKLTKKALAIYPASEWEKLKNRLNELPDSEVGDIKLFLFSHSVVATPDSQGRILLSPDLTDYAGIDKELAIVGVGDHIMIYAADVWQAEEAGQTANLEVMRRKMREIGL
ncbi:MAG: division/cell wall cluster transcriptional repressor MraZ [Clostridia bacterium]|nr:division/cell wall cluster transcriptional repressor MraZ [Clostridia bacterium]